MNSKYSYYPLQGGGDANADRGSVIKIERQLLGMEMRYLNLTNRAID
jgi:hypothetical protein